MEGSAKFIREGSAGDLPIALGGYAEPRRMSRARKAVIAAVVAFAFISLICGAGFYFYWQSLKDSPQYSLALIVDGAKRNDQNTVNHLVDIDAVVDDFLPQITTKAVELYGRGVAPNMIERVARVAAPVMPAVKDRAREELPGTIRRKTAEFGNVPFGAMVLGAEQYLDIEVDGSNATVRSLLPEHDFEVRMKRLDDRWKIVAVRDENLATAIAQRVGQEILAIAVNGTQSEKSRLGVQNINELLNEAEKIFR